MTTKNTTITRVPTHSELMLPTLDAIINRGHSAWYEEIVDQVIDDMNIPFKIADILRPPGYQTELEHGLKLATASLHKAGYIDKSPQGVWWITQKGKEAVSVRRLV